MPLNPSISLAVKPIELQDPLAQYGKVMAIQDAQQRNQLAQMQMQQAERKIQSQNQLRQFVTGMTPQNRNQLLGFGEEGRQAYEALLKGEKESRETVKADEEIAAKRLAEVRNLLPSVQSPEAYANWRQYTIAKLPGLANLIPEQYSPEATRGLMLEADKFLEQHFVNQDTGGAVQTLVMPKYGTGPARVVEGSQAKKTMAPGEAQRLANDAIRIRQEGARIGLEGRRVAVLEENNRRDADPAFQQRMGAARATGEAIAKGDIAAAQAFPKIISRAEEGVRLIDELVGKRDSKTGKLIKGSKPHPGFTESVGATWMPGARFIPGSDAAGFMARFDQIKGSSFLEAFESLKGGGAITEKEGQKGTEAINRMSTSTSEAEFVRAALDLQDVIRKGVENAQRRASRGGGAGGAPAASGNVIDFGSLK